MRHTWGPTAGAVAVLLPGTASTADFITRAFGPPLAALGIGLVTGDPPRRGDVDAQLAALDDAAARLRPVLVGGVSLGAHLAVRWFVGRETPGHEPPAHQPRETAGAADNWRPEGLLLAMPAWTGEPETIAAASAHAAAEVERDGVSATLTGIRRRAADWAETSWVADELAAAWPRYRRAELGAALRASAACPGPTVTELSRVPVPCGLVALRDDPLHPIAVARQWAAALPNARLIETGLAAVGADRAVLGRGAALAWLSASPNRTFGARVQ